MTTLMNLTPHDVVIVRDGAPNIVLPRGHKVPRVLASHRPVGDVHGIPCMRAEYGEAVDLPPYDREADMLYIVSAMVRAAAPGRTDLASPGDLVRDATGVVLGCRWLVVS